jgi:hypothetical protein
MPEQGYSTSFMAPLWWIRAFEFALQMRRLETDPYTMSVAAGLSPALTDAELNALLVVLQAAQAQILQGQKWLSFSPESLQKNNAGIGRTRSFLFLRLLQVLRALQVSAPGNQEPTEPILLFDREERRRDPQGSQRTMYRLAPMAIELLLGFGEPYAELTRLLDGKPRVHRLLGRYQPLPLRPSVWLDLVQLEQYIFLQLQKASLWEKSNFRWDAVFGRSFDAIFTGIDIPIRKDQVQDTSPFRRRMRVLSRVGRKLMDQGVLKNPQEIDYLAIDQEGDPLTVVWQLHDTEGRERELRAYEMRCARYFREQTLEASLKKLTPVLLPGAVETGVQLWRDIEEAERQVPIGYLRVEGNLLLALPALFLEWSLRREATDILSLPGWIKDSAAVQILRSDRPMLERLQSFAQIIIDQPEYQRDIEEVPRGSFAAPVSLKQREVLEYLALHTNKQSSTRDGSPQLADAQPSRTPARANPVLSQQPARKAPTDADMRRQASEELQRMREKDPKRYQGLKQTYLENLELEKKQIILEMKERMQPQAFDDHLKYSLVKYMVDNPRLWQADGRMAP